MLADALAARHALRPVLLAVFDVLENLVELGLVDLRTLLRLRVERVADLRRAVLLGDAIDHFVVHLLLDEQPAAGTAALALVEVQGQVRAFDGRVEIGVGEDHVRALAAQLEGEPLHRLGRRLLDDLRGGQLAGEGDLVDGRVRHQRRAGRRAVARHDVDHAVRNARLLREPRHPQASERRLLGRLHHDRAAGRQRRAPLPGDHQRREVPRNDLPHHADRLAPRVA